MTSADDLDRVLDVLDRRGLLARAVTVRVGELTVELTSSPAYGAPEQPKTEADAKAALLAPRRQHYEGLFNRPVDDAELARLP